MEEVSGNTIPCLSVQVTVKGLALTIKVSTRTPTNTGCYLNFESDHQSHVKRRDVQGPDSKTTAIFKHAKTYSMKLISLDAIFSSEYSKRFLYSIINSFTEKVVRTNS
jgi:hypothetical protein